jgi:hypothetical protein
VTLRRFLSWLRDNGRATDDWQTGDLAVCIDTRPWINLSNGFEVGGPTNGEVERVRSIKLAHGTVFLFFERGAHWFLAASFRKVTPRQDEACSAAFKRQVMDCRPKVDA